MSKRIYLSAPHMDGEEFLFIKEAFDSNYIAPLGPQVDAFEREFAEEMGFSHAIALSSGTAAMHLALSVLGVGPGDEVMASTLTFIGSVTPIVFQGARPVFIDSDRSSWNMDPDLLAEELKSRAKQGKLPKAVVPTDIYGQCSDYDRIMEICARYDIPVVVDSAEALGATYKGRSAGNGAQAAIFSFNGNKIITTSGGGMLASDDRLLIEQAKFLSQQARDPAPHYEHSQIGYNYRMSNVLAAIGRGQFRVLDERVREKRRLFDYYKNALENVPGIEFIITPEQFGADRESVRLALEARNIEARPVWKPMHLQPVFRGGQNGSKPTYDARVVGGAVTEDLFHRGLCLPSGTAMTKAETDMIISIIKECWQN
ncbi:MAG: hypothetical protein B6245_21395 [Desulfobacteraceae bacterium 4572_88]|nr:MAG: hypothetical protein B6245_21395 [Desulfobacteraceae bacterium 4572_88]